MVRSTQASAALAARGEGRGLSSRRMRAWMRSTLPSTAAARRWKAMEATAPAV